MSEFESGVDVDLAPDLYADVAAAPAQVTQPTTKPAGKPAGKLVGKPASESGSPTPKKIGPASGTLQMKATGGAPTTSVDEAAAHAVSGAAHALPFAAQIQASFGAAHDISRIKAHTDEAATRGAHAMGAHAFANGERVVFSAAPDLHTAAHEAAHVVQQRAGVEVQGGVGAVGDTHEQQADAIADRVVAGQSATDLLPRAGAKPSRAAVQMRRLPTNTGELLQDPANANKDGVNHAANLAGMQRVVRTAMAELSLAETRSIEAAAKVTFKIALVGAPTNAQMIQLVDAIVALRPELALGDPRQIDAPPKPGAETDSLKDLVNRTNVLFDAAIARDKDIGDIFGTANIAVAKAKYQNGKQWLNALHASANIVTDRSGYNNEVGLGGLTGFQSQIALHPETNDATTTLGAAVKNVVAANAVFAKTPTAAAQDAVAVAQVALQAATRNMNEAMITLLHEAMHAGNHDVHDNGYINDQAFSKLPEATKLVNAAHFEVVPRRILNCDSAFKGQVFVPAGTTSTSGDSTIVAAPLTASQKSIREASESIRLAWTLGLNLHGMYDKVYKDQTLWTAPQLGGSCADGLPYWSKVEMLTIHQKTTRDPTSRDVAAQPVSQIDMAISEGVIRKLVNAMILINSVPDVDADAATMLATQVSAAEIAGATSDEKRRDLWIRFVLRAGGSLTGDEARDLRVVHEMESGLANWNNLLIKRDPNGF